jgi:hypothetical protein
MTMDDSARMPRNAEQPDVQNDFDAARTRDAGSAEVVDEEPDLTTTPHTLDGTDVIDADVEPSFVDQELLTDPEAAPGSPDDLVDPVADGDEVYVPPTDPVVAADDHGRLEVLGGFSATAIDEVAPLASASDGQLGDEAIEDAVRAALRRDAATTSLEISVLVRDGVVHLSGRVTDLDDAENAEDVASRVPGVREVVEGLDVVEV